MRKNVLAALVVLALTVPAIALASDIEDLGESAGAGGVDVDRKTAADYTRFEYRVPINQPSIQDLEMEESVNVIKIALSPLTIPADFMSVPYRSFGLGWRATEKIKSDVGRMAVRIVAAPFFVPAVILKVPSFLLGH